VSVPTRFWDDHCDRCPCDGDPQENMTREVRRAAGRVLIEGTEAQIEALRSDAAFYCDPAGPDQAPPGLVRSDAATLRALQLEA